MGIPNIHGVNVSSVYKQDNIVDPMLSDLETEKSILGSIIKDSELIDDVAVIIKKPEYFYNGKHQIIYKALADMAFVENVPVDVTTLIEFLGKSNLKTVGGRVYIVQLCELAVAGCYIKQYCQNLAKYYQLRIISDSFSEIAGQARRTDVDVQKLIGNAEKALLKLSDDDSQKVVQISSVITDYAQKIINRTDEQRKDRYIETRIQTLNNKITGFFKQDMVIVASPPSFGKTSFAIDTSWYNINTHKKKILVFSIDQSADSFKGRLITNLTGIPRTQLLSGKLKPEEEKLIFDATNELTTKPGLYLTDRAGLTVFDIISLSRRVKRQHGLDMIVIDYLQQIAPHSRFETRNLEVAEISRLLKQTAKELDIVVLALSQLNRIHDMRNVNPKKEIWGFPYLSDLRDSGALEQDANIVLFPWVIYEVLKKKFGEQSMEFKKIINKHPEYETLTYILVAKNKDGETGVIECSRDIERMRFYNEARQEYL